VNLALFCLELVPKSAFFEAILLVLDNRRTLDIFRTVIFRHFFQSENWSLTEVRALELQSCFFLLVRGSRNNEDVGSALIYIRRCGYKELN